MTPDQFRRNAWKWFEWGWLGREELMKFDDDVWKRWAEEWLPRIKKDLQQTIRDQVVFRDFRTVVADNVDWIDSFEGGFFCHFVARSYLASAALGVRRHVKSNDGAISLMRLLEQIAKCASQITYGHYLVYFPLEADGAPWQELTFGSLAKDGTPRVLSREIIAADMQKLRDLSAKVETFADKNLAHLDRNGFDGHIAWEEIEAAVSQFDRTACRYITLLTGDGYQTLEPTILINWQRVFDNPMRKSTNVMISETKDE
jgi:hypothetical protein